MSEASRKPDSLLDRLAALLRNRGFGRAAASVLLCGVLGSARGVHSQSDYVVSEYELKAAFLFNFTKYVEWPQSAFRFPDEPWTICVLGRDPFGRTLDDVLAGETARDRQLTARRIQEARDAAACHIVFISAAEDWRLDDLFQQLAGAKVLTVGESPDFARLGGIIGLRSKDDELHFEINVDAAERSDLRLSAQLLKLADNLIGKPSE